MPLYEYRCSKCGSVFEVLQKLSDPPLSIHDRCGGVVERLISPPAFQFKGSGWYVTDYAKGGDKGRGTSPDKKPAGVEKPAAAQTTPEAAKPAKPAAEAK